MTGTRIATLVDVVVLSRVTWVIGMFSGAFDGFPKGYDALGHVGAIRLLLDSFPWVSWNPAWYAGIPTFEGSYPPAYHAVAAGLVAITGCSIPAAMDAVTIFAMLAIVLGLYGFVRVASHSRLGALTAAVLVVGAPIEWNQILAAGLYPRLLGMGFASLAIFAAAAYTQRQTRWRLVATAVALALDLSSHPIPGLIGVVAVGGLLAFAPGADWTARFRRLAAVGASVGGLVAYFYLPLVLVPRGATLFSPTVNQLPLQALFWPSEAFGSTIALPAALVVLVGGLGLVSYRYLRRPSPSIGLVPAGTGWSPATAASGYLGRLDRWQADRAHLGAPLSLAAICVGASLLPFGYVLIGHLASFRHYIDGLQPQDVLAYPAWLLAGAVGITVGAFASHPSPTRVCRLVAPLSLAAALASLGLTLTMLGGAALDYDNVEVTAMQRMVPATLASQHQYRLGAANVATSEWINDGSDVSQVQGYQAQGLVNPDYQVWLEDAIGSPGWNAAERSFLFDWYALGWVLAGPGPAPSAPYRADPAKFSLLATETAGTEGAAYPVSLYRVLHPSPVLSPSTAPTLLVIGPRANYELVLRALASGDLGPSSVVPVEGAASIDDYSPSELGSFDEVMLYGATAADPRRDARALSAYVAAGGGLVVEGAGDGPVLEALSQAGLHLGVKASLPTPISRSWDFVARPGSVAAGVALGSFAPPVYGAGGPWEVQAPTALARGAQVALRAQGVPVVRTERIGRGRVVWSGMNLAYHIAANDTNVTSSAAESAFFGKILTYATRASMPTPAPLRPPTSYAVSFPDAQDASIRLAGGAKGVLFEESYTPDWHASVDGVPVGIDTAGPGMMYVPVGPHTGVVTVRFSYRLGRAEHAGIVISLLSVISLLGLVLGLTAPRRLRTWAAAQAQEVLGLGGNRARQEAAVALRRSMSSPVGEPR